MWRPIQLKPGVDTQLTPVNNEAGVSQSQMIRYKEGLIQTYGGWVNFVSGTIASTVRDLHPWQDINGNKHLGVAATNNLVAITAGSFSDITPQTVTSDVNVSVSVSSGSNVATITDANANASIYNTVYFNTPIAIAGLLINGAYPIHSVGSSTVYSIVLSGNSTSTISSGGTLPKFTISSGSGAVTVTLPNNGFQSITGLFQQFIAPSSGAGQTIQGKYAIASVIDSTTFTINLTQQATASSTVTMNSTLMEIVYYVTLGPNPTGVGWGDNGWGLGGYGGAGGGVQGTPGTNITATDWTQDNWGEILLACPQNGPVYAWAADFGFQNAQVVNTAPFFSGGLFVSMPQQILVCWRSTQASGVQDPLIVRWSNAGDYTNWTVSNQTTAGSFHLPSGSIIIGGIQCPQFALISTDIEVWMMTYVGGVVIFNFQKVGNGCGWISSHACGILSGNPFWMGLNNFFTLGSSGVVPLSCTVWDQVFQNLSAANQGKVRVGVNSAFNEIAWFYPSANSAGENDSYVKVHMEGQEYEWDYGTMSRTAWTDVSILGMPLGVDNSGQIYQHETGTAITGVGLPSFQTGYWVISEGEDIPFIDFIVPDFDFGLRSGSPNASINITFFGINYATDVPVTYGPYTVTSTTSFINIRSRHRMMSALIKSNASTEFWRLGRIRFRVGASGRR